MSARGIELDPVLEELKPLGIYQVLQTLLYFIGYFSCSYSLFSIVFIGKIVWLSSTLYVNFTGKIVWSSSTFFIIVSGRIICVFLYLILQLENSKSMWIPHAEWTVTDLGLLSMNREYRPLGAGRVRQATPRGWVCLSRGTSPPA